MHLYSSARVLLLFTCLLACSTLHGADAVFPADTIMADSSMTEQQSLAIGASANTLRVPISSHTDFDSQGLGEAADQSRSSLLRREVAAPSVTDLASRRTTLDDDASSHDQADSDIEDNDPVRHDDPRFTPEAIFGNKDLAPEVAEFLGHLAQRGRVHRKEVSREVRQAGLAQGSARRAVSDGDDNDPSDDIEDMKRAAASKPKTTTLSHFFEALDSKSTARAWLEKDCSRLAQNITQKYAQMSGRSRATWGTAGPAGAAGHSEIHTGMFFKHWTSAKKKESARKLRLSVLSFLATQDAGKMKLHIWTDLDKGDKTLKDVLGPIARRPELMDAINITTFDHHAEFAKVPASLAKETLTELYTKDSQSSLNSELYRAVILYNYGGMWMDADTVLLQDVAPLLGEDWAYLVKGKEGAVSGSMLSASKPRSHFSNAYLINMVMRAAEISDEQAPLLVEIFNADPSHTTLHVLPPCFFDSDPMPEATETAVLSSDAYPGSVFFGNAVAEPYRALFSLGIQDAAKDNSTADVSVLEALSSSATSKHNSDSDGDQTPQSSPSWAYHWRRNFEAPWARGSMADVAERTFMKKLSLKYKKSFI